MRVACGLKMQDDEKIVMNMEWVHIQGDTLALLAKGDQK